MGTDSRLLHDESITDASFIGVNMFKKAIITSSPLLLSSFLRKKKRLHRGSSHLQFNIMFQNIYNALPIVDLKEKESTSVLYAPKTRRRNRKVHELGNQEIWSRFLTQSAWQWNITLTSVGAE